MTNPDNVGGLVWYVCTSCMLMVQLPSDTPTLGRCQCSPKGWSLRRAKLPKGYELCRAAPAGGDDLYRQACDSVEEWKARALEAEADIARIHAQINAENGPTFMGEPVVSAPAGSGEVSRMDALYNFLMGIADLDGVSFGELHPNKRGRFWWRHELAAAYALLRKLQQPAEEDAYVIEQMGRLLAEIAIIVNGQEPALTKWSYHDLPEKIRKLQQGADYVMVPRVASEKMHNAGAAIRGETEWEWNGEDEYAVEGRPDPSEIWTAMIAASQDQEGGTNG